MSIVWFKKQLHWWILGGMVVGTLLGTWINAADHRHAGSISAIVTLRGPQGERLLVSGGRDGVVKVWSADTTIRWQRSMREGRHGEVSALAVAPGEDGQLVIAYRGGALALRTLDGKRLAQPPVAQLQPKKGYISALHFSADGGQLLVGESSGAISLWQFKPLKRLVHVPAAHNGAVREIVMLPGESVSIGADGQLTVVDLVAGKVRFSTVAHSVSITALLVLSDKRTALTGSSDGQIHRWDLKRGRRLKRFLGHKGAVIGLAELPSKTGFASAGRDKTFRLWSFERPRALTTLHSASGLATALLALSGDRWLAVSGKQRNQFALIVKVKKQLQLVVGPRYPFLSVFDTIGAIFIRLLKLIIVPLVLTSLVAGVASLGDMRKLGRMGLKTFVYYMTTTAASVIVGLVLVNAIQPGRGIQPLMPARPGLEPKPMIEILLDIFSTNIFKSLSSGDILPIIFFSLLLGAAMTTMGKKAEPLKNLFDSAFEAIIKIVDWIMLLAPLGVMALLAKTVAEMGIDLLLNLIWYCVTVLVGLAFHAVVTLSLVLWFFGKVNPLVYARQMARALMTAFSTDSSSATLPVTMECVEQNAGISNRVSSFVLPLGATVNMDGTALYEAVAAMFIAQVYGIELGLTQQAVIFLTATLAAIGAAGVPSAGLVTMIIVLRAVGLPIEGIGILVGVDRILDMCRTTVNVWGDAVGAKVIARSEGE